MENESQILYWRTKIHNEEHRDTVSVSKHYAGGLSDSAQGDSWLGGQGPSPRATTLGPGLKPKVLYVTCMLLAQIGAISPTQKFCTSQK